MYTSWMRLKHPGLIHAFAPPVVLNNNEIILSSQAYIDCLQQANKYEAGIYKYDIKQQVTSLFISYSQFGVDLPIDGSYRNNLDRFQLQFHTISLDEDKKHLYILGGRGDFLIIDLKTKSKIYYQRTERVGDSMKSCFINGQFHVIGGYESKKHIIWNEKTKEFDVEHVFNDFQHSYYGFALIYIENRNCLYLLSGMDGSEWSQSIYIYSLKNRKWIKSASTLNWKIPTKSFIPIENGKYVLMFYNMEDRKKPTQYVHILNLDTMEIIKTNTELPKKLKACHALMCSPNIDMDELLVYGYVRYVISINLSITNISKIILKWVTTHYIYLFEAASSIAPKWYIDLQHIV